jgi:uncharacterized Zn finger protein (UPF0148 family)
MINGMRRLPLGFLALLLFLSAAMPAAEDQRCAVCGIALTGEAKYFRTSDGKESYCEHCFNTAPRCTVCGLPSAPGKLDARTGVCDRCAATLPHCKACGKLISGSVYTVRFAAGQFCRECKESRPACYVCGVPVGPGYWKYPDGRIVCSECGERAVIDVADMRRIMRDVEETVQKRLGLAASQPYDLKIEKLSASPGDNNRHLVAPRSSTELYSNELGMYRRTSDRSEIVLLFGLPSELVYEAAAHEYAHAWWAENCRPNVTPELREGFAQWVAAEVLRSKRYWAALERLEAREDYPYGTGYRRVRSMQREALWQLILAR